MTSINDFLEFIQGSTKNSIIRIPDSYINKEGKRVPFHKTISLSKVTHHNGKDDLYYIPNIGGTRNIEIHEFTTCFVDLDCGRDESKNYYPEEIVQEYKRKQWEFISAFPLQPSIINETRNGFQPYWVLKDSPDKERWLTVMKKLITVFNSDISVQKPCQVMRLPFTTWLKPKSGLPPFRIVTREFSGSKYDISDLEKALKDVVIREDVLNYGKGSLVRHKTTVKSSSPSKPVISSDHIKILTDSDIEAVQKIIKPHRRAFSNYNEFYQHMTQKIDLGELLGVSGSSFCCVFHDDTTPSAGIFRTSKGEQFYKCHSDKCGFTGNIRRIVERLRGYNSVQAIDFIKEVYDLTIEESSWQIEQKRLLEECRRFILYEMEEMFPELHRNVVYDLPLLLVMIDTAIDSVLTEDYADPDGAPVFFTSLRHLAKSIGITDAKTVGKKIANLAYHRLIVKKPEAEIPNVLYSKSKAIKQEKGHKHTVSFYSIPSYCDENLVESEDRAALFAERPLTRRGATYEGYYRTYGPDIADEVFPQIRNKPHSAAAEERTAEIHSIALELIEERGWVLEKEILELMTERHWQTIAYDQIKRSLYEMLDSYNLNRVRLTKNLKMELGIEVKGYPYVLMPKVG